MFNMQAPGPDHDELDVITNRSFFTQKNNIRISVDSDTILGCMLSGAIHASDVMFYLWVSPSLAAVG